MKLISVMYHFVNNADRIRLPALKSLTPDAFAGQLDYLLAHHTPITPAELRRAARGWASLPENGFVLTFDHGTRDHLEVAVPELCRRGLEGMFFVMTSTLEHGTIPAIDKQRYLEGHFTAYDRFLDTFCRTCANACPELADKLLPTEANLAMAAYYLSQFTFYSVPERFFRMIRNEVLTGEQFIRVIEAMFNEVFGDEQDIARDYYLTWDDCRQMVDAGMTIGSHGHEHIIYSDQHEAAYSRDLHRSFELLRSRLGRSEIDTLSYPNGACHDRLAGLLDSLDVWLAFTTQVGITFDINSIHPARPVHSADQHGWTMPRGPSVHLPGFTAAGNTDLQQCGYTAQHGWTMPRGPSVHLPGFTAASSTDLQQCGYTATPDMVHYRERYQSTLMRLHRAINRLDTTELPFDPASPTCYWSELLLDAHQTCATPDC